MKQAAILLCAFLSIACGGNFEGELSTNDTAITEYVDFVAQRQETDQIAGVALAIVSKDDVLFMDGFGMRDVEAHLPVTEETLFHIGSITKSFTALLIASLVEEDIMTWDTSAAQIYPNFALSEPEATQHVTLRHLVSMRGGIPDYVEDDFDIDRATGKDIFPFLAEAELLDAPLGATFSYSNLSSTAAGYLAVIAATGDDQNLYDGYADLLTERVLRPIGMKNATVRVSDLYDNPNYGYAYVLEDGELAEAEPTDFDGDPLAPSGSIKASISEMAMYVQLQLGRGIAANGERVVSAETITELWKPYLEGYALGWEAVEIDGGTLVQHEGAFDNYLSIVGFIPEQEIGFVILTNTENAAEEMIDQSADLFVALFGQ